MSDLMRRIMHPFTYKTGSSNTFKIRNLDTKMTPMQFGLALPGIMREHGEDPKRYISSANPEGWCKSAAEWFYMYDPEDRLP